MVKQVEGKIQKSIIDYLLIRRWYVKNMHGNAYQAGMPDLFATHTSYGIRLIEIKKPGMVGSRFTDAQIITFPQLCANGAGVWVLTAATEDEYRKLFGPPNWHGYLL